jgi:hypothetical protein
LPCLPPENPDVLTNESGDDSARDVGLHGFREIGLVEDAAGPQKSQRGRCFFVTVFVSDITRSRSKALRVLVSRLRANLWRKATRMCRRRRGAGETTMGAYRTDAAFVRAVARMDTSVGAATALVTLDRLIMDADFRAMSPTIPR